MSSRAQVNDRRRAPFCYQTVESIRAIHAAFIGRRRAVALAIYTAMTYLANEQRAREFAATRAAIGEVAGVTKRTLDEYVEWFVKAGLLEVERRREEGLNLPNVWHLVEPDPEQGGGAANSTTGAADDTTVGARVAPGVAQQTAPVVEEEQQEEVEEKDMVVELFDHWRQAFGLNGQTKLTPGRRQKLQARLKTYDPARIKRAIDGCAGSEFHRTNGHIDLTLICRSDEKLEEFERRPVAAAPTTNDRSAYDQPAN